MTVDDSPALPAGGLNPFPSAAVAQLAQIGAETVTISTAAVRAATAELRDYLSNTAGPGGSAGRGRVMAIVGDYGSGKSHLAFHLLHVARKEGGGSVEHLYLSTAPTRFSELYRVFARTLYERKSIVEDRVRRLYAEVVAESLANSRAHEPVRQSLLDDAVDPKELVHQNRWAESIFLSRVKERLTEITENDAFITALALLMRDGFSEAVWEWFLGNDPDAVLRDRGVTERITAHETVALEAMGVFALLISHGPNRFVVVVDEIQQLLSAANRPTDELLGAFKQLLGVFVSAGAFLVLAGVPDFLNALPQDVLQRITTRVEMSALTAPDAVSYIEQRQKRELGVERLEPFSADTVAYLVSITNGVPRHIVALCYFLYRRAVDEGVPVNDAMVRSVAREKLYARSTDSLHNEIRRVLTARGLAWSRDRFVGATEVDYYVPLGELGGGRVYAAALLVTDAVLDDSHLDSLVERINEIRNEGNHEILLVVSGSIPMRYQGRLREALGRDPLAYEARRFSEQLEAELTAVERRFERLTDRDPIVTLLARVDRMGQQLSNAQGLILKMASHLDTVASTSEQRVSELANRLNDVIEGTSGVTAATVPPAATAPGLPAEVAEAFNEIAGLLDAPRRVNQVLDLAFRDLPESVPARRLLRMTLRQPRTHTAAGVAVLLQELTGSYRGAVTDWYRALTGTPAEEDLQRLKELGETYTVLLDYLPIYQMEQLADFSLAADGERDSTLSDSLRTNRLMQANDALAALCGRVEALLLSSLSDLRATP